MAFAGLELYAGKSRNIYHQFALLDSRNIYRKSDDSQKTSPKLKYDAWPFPQTVWFSQISPPKKKYIYRRLSHQTPIQHLQPNISPPQKKTTTSWLKSDLCQKTTFILFFRVQYLYVPPSPLPQPESTHAAWDLSSVQLWDGKYRAY